MILNKTPTRLHPPRNNKTLTFFRAVFSLFAVFILSSCEFWNQPVRDYFEKWTNEVAIEKFEVIGVESYQDKDGNLCIASDQPAPVTLFMRNPYHYVLTSSNISRPEFFPEIAQDSEDTTLLHFTFSTDYLLAREGGQELGAELAIIHPWRPEEKSYNLSLKCNSKPPKIEEAAILYGTDAENQNYYVLAFNCPDPTPCSSTGIHKDIVAVNINGVSYNVQPDSSGNMVFADNDIFKRGIRGSLHTLNKEFNNSTRSVYFVTSDPVINGVDKTFSVGFMDSAGLENLITLDTKVPSVATPTVFNNDDNELVLDGMNILHTDSGQVYSTVRIEAPTTDSTGQPLENPSVSPEIKWELHSGETIAGTSLTEDIQIYNSNGTASLKIPEEGEYTLVVWAAKEGYTSSARSEYHLKLEYATLKAPVVKDYTASSSTYTELLSSTPTNNYIELDSYDKITVHIKSPTETTANEPVPPNLGDVNDTIIHYAINSGNATTEKVNAARDFFENIQGFGQYCLTVYATKEGYNESEHVSYLIKAHNTELYVAQNGIDETGDGSEAHPYATIQKAVDEFAAYNDNTKDYTLNVSGTLPGGQTVKNLEDKANSLLIKGADENAAIDANNLRTALCVQNTTPQVKLESIILKNGNGFYQGNTGKGGGLYAYGNTNVIIGSSTKIISNKVTEGNNIGGGVYVAQNATVALSGGTIGGSAQDANWAGGSGGAVFIESGGTFTLNSGTISYNYVDNSTSSGGGIYNNGILNISGGTISYNHSGASGGGIYNGGTLYVYDGTISNNYTGDNGGGIYNAKNLDLEGGLISSNYTTTVNYGRGGGVFNNKTFTMTNGTISGNYHTTATKGQGGGVYTNGTSSNFTISGGTITGNTDTASGKGVYVASPFTMSGNAQISSNNDVYLPNGRTINISGDLGSGAGAKITPQSWIRKTEILIGTVNADNAGKFSLSEVGWRIAVVSSKGYIDAKSIYVKQDGNDDSNNGTSESPYKTISKAASVCFNSSGDYEINVVGTLEGSQVIPSDNNISAQKITILGDGSSSTLDGKKQGSTLSIYKNNIPIEIYGLTITGGQATNGGGLFINAATTVILRATEISGNKATDYGGGVYIGTSAKLCMYGTATIGVWTNYEDGNEISTDNCGNQATYGGGVVNYGKLYLGYKDVGVTDSASKGIVNNLAVQGGGIYNRGNDAEIFINSGTVYGNRATGDNVLSGAGGGIYLNGSLTMTGGDIEENYADSSGGGILIRPGTILCALNGGTISNNAAGSTGGAITAEDTFKIGSGINIPYGGDVKQNDVHIYPTGNKAPSIYADALSYTYLKPANPIHITGLTAVYNVNYQVLTGNISASYGFIDPGSYNGHEWAVDTNGYMMIAN